MTNRTLDIIDRVKRAIATVRVYVARVRKALIPALAALALIVGTDAPLYQDIVAILVALGVYTVPNRPGA